ncbi:hypothetical protein [Rhodoferax sp. GW822-FHT02A01]|uniref:hypothetical protein n=1 Tax=Rhodoferax sp. GW822-FHT02A01 TaxID=3141537 RepID=UPI00315DC86B
MQSILIGAGRTFDRIGKGAKQIYYGVTGDTKAQNQLAQAAADDDRAYAPLQQARPFSTGVGEALPSMVVPAGGGATLGANMVRQATAAALPSLLSYGSAKDRLEGAAWNGAAGATMPALGVAAKTAYAAAEPFWQAGQNAIIGRTLNRVAGSDVQSVIQRLKGAAPLVPGSLPTAAQVAENGGIASLERSAAAVNPQAYTNRKLAQALARKDAVDSVAGTQTALDDAINMRKTVADSTYGYANQVGPDPRVFTPEAQANIAAMQARVPAKALQDARDIANIYGAPMDNGTVVNGLHWTKTALSGMADAEQNPAKAGALKYLTGQFNDGLEQISPLYGAANSLYQDMSVPINQMQVGQALRDKVLPALTDHGMLGQERANAFAQALADDGLPARATGFPGATWGNTMTPAQMDTLNGVAGDLARVKNAENLGRGVGSDTVQKLAMQNIASQSGIPSAMGLVTNIGGKPLSWIYDGANDTMQSKLADALLNPQSAASYMSNAVPSFMTNSPAAKNLLIQSLLRSSMLIPSAGATADQVLTPALTAE